MNSTYWTVFGSVILAIVTLIGCSSQPTATPQSIVLTDDPVSTEVAVQPAPTLIPGLTQTETTSPATSPPLTSTSTLALPVLAGTPVPLPQEPITPDNVDQIQQLAMWGKGRIEQLAYSPDGKILAVGTTAGVWLYNAETLVQLRFINTGNFVGSLAFTSDNQKLVTDVGASTLATWDVATSELLNSVRMREGYQGSVVASPGPSVFSQEAMLLAATLDDRTVGLWEVANGQRLQVLRSNNGSETIKTLAISPDQSLLATGINNKLIKLWDIRTGNPLHILTGPEGNLYSLAFSPDSKILATGADKGKVWLWDTQTGTSISILEGGSPSSFVGALAFSSDNAQLAAAVYEPSSASGTDSTVNLQLWRVADGTLLHTLKGDRGAISLVFSPDNRLLVSGASDGSVRRWDSQTGALVNELNDFDASQGQAGQMPPILAFLLDDNVFISNPSNYQIELWNLKKGQLVKTLAGHKSMITNLVISTHYDKLVSSERWDNTIRVWDPTTSQILGIYEVYIDIGYGKELAISPNGQLIAIGDARARQRAVYKSADLDKWVYQLPKENWSSNPAFSPDGQKIAWFPGPTMGAVSKAENGELLHTLETGDHDSGLGFSPDSQVLAIGDQTGAVQLWDIATGDLLNILSSETGNRVASLTYSPDGRILAVGLQDVQLRLGALTPTIWLWDVKTSTLLKAIEGYQANVIYLAFSSDGTLLATASLDGTMRLWGVPPPE